MRYYLKIWDLSTRLFHWSLVLLIIFLWYSADVADDLMEWHVIAGEFFFALLIFRVVWGFCGSETSRFGHFIGSPFRAVLYFFQFLRGRSSVGIGHNPAGGYMVLFMLVVLFIQVISGLFNSDDVFIEGRFYAYVDESFADWMGFIHYQNFYVLLFLVGLHLLVISIYALRGDNLVSPMLSGGKWVKTAITQPIMVSSLKAFFVFMMVMFLVFFGLRE